MLKTRYLSLKTLLAATTLLASVSLLPWTQREADACGGVMSRNANKQPALELEQVLIIHDPKTEIEHFIRQVTFRDADDPFGFVVPTPEKPEVNKVEEAPFGAMARVFPPEPPDDEERFPAEGLFGGGKGGGGANGVTVLSQKQIGSFTAFVIAATDAKAFKEWLDSNKFKTNAEIEAWLKHYVDQGFYYVAFRYEPSLAPKKDNKSPSLQDPFEGRIAGASPKKRPTTRAETVRITFSTPVAYYPYLEPLHTAKPKEDEFRVLAVWVTSTQRVTPLSLHTKENRSLWEQPWQEGAVFARPSKEYLGTTMGANIAKLLPEPLEETPEEKSLPEPPSEQTPITINSRGKGPRLVVQAFEDQKVNRQGWGDVLLVPESPMTLSDADIQKRKKLFAIFDPALNGGQK